MGTGELEETQENQESKVEYVIELTKLAEKEIGLITKSSTPAVKKKLSRILHELKETPTVGTGVEKLKGKDGIGYSRELSKKDRVVYLVYEEKRKVVIIQFLNHYDDK